ncbi:TspO/MBR family protein [Nocardioides sp. GY 10127]|uniref:TspO/MBR family protein n=1 Tax=Nocardioides sp. GY 10127 TaxID=2569762 RepID=UPI0010A8DE17|nr:TspO/MBR family protein [Nocardioides sp. GY 10127]TIC79260.1 tryptophan-rich sensory protein [Nocardioides sp. GY 10127]
MTAQRSLPDTGRTTLATPQGHADAGRRTAPSRGRQVAALVGFLVAVAVAAGVGGLAASSAASDYAALELPAWAPPSWLFAPVWSVLYVLIALAAWQVWRRHGADRFLGAWTVQLVLNACWTPLFFAAALYGWALVEIVVLLVAVATTLVLGVRRERAAGVLLAPYLLWVAFATCLNAAIWWLNR